jgi:NosR/NirI family transcriptional regulator, nitrous oxide reductase regulator
MARFTNNSRLSGRFRLLAALLLVLLSTAVFAQYQRKPPDFGGSYSFPTPTHPEPRTALIRGIDVGVLVLCLGLASWIVLKRRSRSEMVLLSIASIGYFGFYRKGCTCPIGAIQNVTLSLVDSHYMISMAVIAFFFLPLIAALLFGRVFCGGVCALGAVQDLVLIRPLKIPAKLDKALSWVPYIYLVIAIIFAGWGLHFKLGSWQVQIGKRFLICEWDPFISLFRISGAFHMLAIGGGFILLGMFFGRPYCRWLCPYGGLLAILSRIARKNLQITPDKETDCGLCADACPFGAIHNLRADRASCLSCARCYESCPQHIQWREGIPADERLVQLEK